MPARGGRDYITRLREQPPEVWLGGERVKDVTGGPVVHHPADDAGPGASSRHDGHWARATCGMMGRTPDFLNVSLMAMAAAGDYFAQNRPAFKDHIRRYYEYVREHDLTLTHTLLNMQRSRAPGPTPLTDQTDIALSVVRETDVGIVVHGCRLLATLGPLSDEIAVYPARSHHLPNDAAGRYSFAFAT